VNALWPRTAIDTAAIGFIMDQEARRRSRLPAIMADAAHWILTQPARSLTGRFLMDEDV
jgi:citronellol/citronellal dehydrogenase